ncbi:hypothetical protein [Ornithinimicrobium avium]|nr:hypothetical protein [Ornithinimicrobium avium]
MSDAGVEEALRVPPGDRGPGRLLQPRRGEQQPVGEPAQPLPPAGTQA